MDTEIERAERLDAIVRKVGFALWQIQELEGVAAQYFVFVTLKSAVNLSAANILVEKAQKRTFGTTLRQIAEAGLLDSGLSDRLTKFKDERNWLVHHSRRTHRSAVHSATEADRLFLRLDAVAEDSYALLKELLELVKRHAAEKYGLRDKDVETATNQLLIQWHAADE